MTRLFPGKLIGSQRDPKIDNEPLQLRRVIIRNVGPVQALREGAAPFVYDSDPRIYRPTVPVGLNVEVPATPSSRMLVSRGPCSEELGLDKKSGTMMEATRHSHLQMLANAEASRRSGAVCSG